MESVFYCRSCGNEQTEIDTEKMDLNCPQCGEKMEQKEAEAKSANKSGIKITVFSLLIVFVIAALLLLKPKDEKYSSPDIPFPKDSAKIVDSLLESARALSKKTPFMVDNSTQLDEIVVKGTTITYRNTLVNLTAEDRARDDVFKMTVKTFLAKKYCTDEKVSKGLKAGVIYDHEYSGRDGTELFSAIISYADCTK